VLAAVFSLPALEYARAGLTGEAAPPGSGARVRLLQPAPWQAYRAGATVDVVAAVDAPSCTVVWDDGTAESVPARRGACAASRVVDRPGLYVVSVTAPGDVAGSPVPVVAYDPHAGPAHGSGVTDGIRYSVEAGYVPWRRVPAATGAGAFDGPDGLSAQVVGVDWVLVSPEPEPTTAVRGTAVAANGTAYGFVLYGDGDDAESLRLTHWQRLTTSPGPHQISTDRRKIPARSSASTTLGAAASSRCCFSAPSTRSGTSDSP
jgi:hypothetical protein